MARITFEHIDKIYDNGFQAVFDFNLEIAHGEFVVFVGPSGCGKSTMMRIVAGLEDATRGDISFDGARVNGKSPKARDVAMVFQSYALYPHLDAYGNMAFALTLDGCDEDYIERRVAETADILGMRPYLKRKPRELSGGQCQRVAVGRAIIRRPKVFLMDEPLSNLDAKQRVTMRSEIIEIHRKTGATTVYVTHDQVEAMTMADRIVVMRDGRIRQVGTPRELYFRPADKFVAGFIGDPPMNFIPCAAAKGGVILKGSDGVLKLPARFAGALAKREGGEITLGFRPEAARFGGGQKAGGGVAFEARAQVLELFGDSVSIFAEIGGHSVILKTDPDHMPEENETVKFTVPADGIYLFESGQNEASIEA